MNQFLDAIRRIYAQHYLGGRDPRAAIFLQRMGQNPEAQNPAVQRALALLQYGQE